MRAVAVVGHRVRTRSFAVRSVRARVGLQRGGERVAVRPHRHAPRWRSHALPARVAPMLVAIPSHVFTSRRSRVIVSRPAVGAAPPCAVSHVRSLASPIRLNKAARRPAALLFVPHRDPLRLLPPRAAPTRRASPLLGAAIGVARACGPPNLHTRRHTHARSFPARSRPPDSHRHPKPCAAPPCSSLRSCGAASRRTAQGLPRGELRPAHSVAVSGSVRQSPAKPSDRPTARHAGGSKRESQPTNGADSPRSNAPSERAPPAATRPQSPRVWPALLSLLLCERWPAAKNKL